MMYDYDKDAFIAGYRAAFALRGWGTQGLHHVRQLRLLEPYTVEWHGENSFTVSWTVQDGEVQGLIVEPGLFPVTISGSVDGEQQGGFQWGVCTLDGFLPTVITTGAEREWYVNGIPDGTVITDPDPTNMGSVFCGDAYATPGARMTLTVSWGGISLARIVTEAGEPLITADLWFPDVTVINMSGSIEFAATRYASTAPDAPIEEYGIERLVLRDASQQPIYDAPDVHVFWANITDGLSGNLVYWVVCIDEQSLSQYQNCNLMGYFQGNSASFAWSLPFGQSQWVHAGGLYYASWGTINARPNNSALFTGTQADLQDYLSGVTARYLITN